MSIVTKGRTAALSHDSLTDVPASAQIRCLRDWMVVEPLPIEHSKILEIVEDTRPVRGIVKAVGPGVYPIKYDHPDKHKRTKMSYSHVFRPTSVKVGDLVELGSPQDGRGYAFQTFRWGDVTHLLCREEDVSGVVERDGFNNPLIPMGEVIRHHVATRMCQDA